jgi:transcriptional repressor NrdR
MRCPFCTCNDTQVKDSRPYDEGGVIRRKRLCPECGARFSTVERLEYRELFVIKKSGQRRVFEREKLARSVYTALRKRDVNIDEVERGISILVSKLESMQDDAIPTGVIGDMVLRMLEPIDLVAYVRFASVYKDFREPADFEDFVRELPKQT